MNANRTRIDLRAMREAAEGKLGVGIGIAEAADMVLVSRRAWQRWENENKTIPTGVVKRFCACTGLNPTDWLPEGEQ